MKIDDVKLLSDDLIVANDVEVDSLQDRFWITFPEGYREYVTRLGEGVLGGSLVRVYPPWRIEKELDPWRQRIDKFWLWDQATEVLPKERALECVILGDTVNGDEFVFHPNRPQYIFVLPRNEEVIYEITGGLLTAVEWMCSSGKLCRRFKEREFEAFDSRLSNDDDTISKTIDPPGESLDDIFTTMKAWTKRHHINRKANKAMRKQIGKGQYTELFFKGICLESDGMGLDAGDFVACWDVSKEDGGEPTGRFVWSKGEFSEGSSYTPA
ncbi:MAG: hypothetical protein AAGB26_16450 [Planctomycetota bacterium]